MMFKNGMISIAAAAALFMTGCGDTTNEAAKTDDTHVVDKITVKVPVILRDVNGNPMAKQKVNVDGKNYTTDSDGMIVASASVVPNNVDTIEIGAANFDVTVEADDGTETTTSYVVAAITNLTVNEATFNNNAAQTGADNQVITDSDGARVPTQSLTAVPLTDSFTVHVENATTGEAIASTDIIINCTTNNVQYATTIKTGTDGDLNITKFPTNTAWTYTFNAAGYSTAAATAISDDARAIKTDLQLTPNGTVSNGDTTGADFSMAQDVIANAGAYTTTGSGAAWLSPSIDGSSANPVVLVFTEDVTVADGAIGVEWATYDSSAFDSADANVTSAKADTLAAIETAIDKRASVVRAVTAIKNHLADDEDTTDNNTTGEAAFVTLWNTYTGALSAYATELNKIGYDVSATDGDGTTLARATHLDVTICDENATDIKQGGLQSCTTTYPGGAGNAGNAARYKDYVVVTAAETALGKAETAATDYKTALQNALDWTVPTTVTATVTASEDKVSIVTDPALPSSDGTSGLNVGIKVTFDRLKITDASGNIMQDTANTATGTGTNTGTFKEEIYLNGAN